MANLYVGLMSGTSMDGIDAALVSFDSPGVEIVATVSQPYPDDLRAALQTAIELPLDVALDTDGALDQRVGECFRDAANVLVRSSGVDASDIVAIGSHGQTLRHQPDATPPFSLQIGNADVIANGTGQTTVANLRMADIEAGGQGAPLVPPFHQYLFGSENENRVVVNIGGIANLTVLPASGADVIGFDTGPGNGLMNGWTRRHLGKDFDQDGDWAAQGSLLEPLLERLLDDPYFALQPPKSSGFEYFNAAWLGDFEVDRYEPEDVQSTLCELSARAIAAAIHQHAAGTDAVYVCGGGAHNRELMQRLDAALAGIAVKSTAAAGLDPDWVEATAFAWLAMRTINNQTGNLPSVTGASHKVVLGDIHSPES